MASADEEASSVPRRRLSCTTCFNSLWFCYCILSESSSSLTLRASNLACDSAIPFSCDFVILGNSVAAAPVHQMQQYYRLGVLDNCSGKWSALVDCLALKTKRASDVQVSNYFILVPSLTSFPNLN